MLGARSNLAKYSRSKQGFDWYLKVTESTKYLLGFNIEDMRAARRLAEEAIAIWPDTAGGYIQMGWIHSFEYILGLGKSEESIEKGIEMAQKALAVSDSTPGAHAILCSLYTLKGEYDKAIAEGERAIAVEPGGAQAYGYYANSLSWAGRPEEAIPLFQKANRLNPLGTTVLYLNFGIALTRAGRFKEAVSAYQKSIQRAPDNILAHVFLASAYSSLGRKKEARAEAAEVLRIDPKFSVDGFSRPIAYMTRPERDKFVNALHKAGLK